MELNSALDIISAISVSSPPTSLTDPGMVDPTPAVTTVMPFCFAACTRGVSEDGSPSWMNSTLTPELIRFWTLLACCVASPPAFVVTMSAPLSANTLRAPATMSRL